MRKITIIIYCSFLITNFVGCATTKYYPPLPQIKGFSGVYHRVQKGQTLWRIAKMYGMDLEDIVKINRIPDSAKIETGQLIFIPGVAKTKDLTPQKIADLRRENFIWPVKGKVISVFGERVNNRINKGIDIQARWGQEVYASKDGEVIFCRENLRGYGKTLIIQHGDEFSTVYANNSEITVGLGDRIEQGKIIAKVGSSRGNPVPYIHFEIRRGHQPQNPFYYLP